jgi:hypothetical protein
VSSTIFPVLPRDVAVLTAAEFAFDLEGDNAPSLDEVCRRFENDAHRALIWLIRSRALKAWCAADGIAAWLTAARRPHICEVAASFELMIGGSSTPSASVTRSTRSRIGCPVTMQRGEPRINIGGCPGVALPSGHR